jgi:hypothetical protein
MNSSAVRVLLLALSLGFVARVDAQKQGSPSPPVPGKLLPSQYLPEQLKLSVGGSSPPSYRVELRGQSLLYHVRAFDPEEFAVREVDTTVTPSAAQWLRFWKAMDAVDVWHWQPSYANPDAGDGRHWGVEIAWGAKTAHSSGHSAYPGGDARSDDADASEPDASPAEPVSAPAPVGVFPTYLRAVEDLLGGARFR